jgi:hypothetical protein
MVALVQGDGVPPTEARGFCDWLTAKSQAGDLSGCSFSVLALGDRCRAPPSCSQECVSFRLHVSWMRGEASNAAAWQEVSGTAGAQCRPQHVLERRTRHRYARLLQPPRNAHSSGCAHRRHTRGKSIRQGVPIPLAARTATARPPTDTATVLPAAAPDLWVTDEGWQPCRLGG